MTDPAHNVSDEAIEQMIAALDSLVDGDRAAEQLISCGKRVIPAVERFLVESRPRSISVSRCRAVRVLGALGAYLSLTRYFRENMRPNDAAVLFAEDAVRSAAARELMDYESPATFRVLLDAAKQRPTSELVQALSQYRWPESVALLFALLEDDLCREDAKQGLRKVPEAARAYAVLLLRGLTQLSIEGSNASRRRRSTLQLLVELGINMNEWPDLRKFLGDEDRDCVVSAATLGLQNASAAERPSIIAALIDASGGMNWAQETGAVELLDKWPTLARQAARHMRAQSQMRGEKPNWLSPFWRILHHVLGDEILEKNLALLN
jgi:hypothetical protein